MIDIIRNIIIKCDIITTLKTSILASFLTQPRIYKIKSYNIQKKCDKPHSN